MKSSRWIISLLTAAIFLAHTVSYGLASHPLTPCQHSESDMLAAGSPWGGLAGEGAAITANVKFELLLGAERLLRGDDIDAVNANLYRIHEKRRRGLRRQARVQADEGVGAVEFIDHEMIDGKTVQARFRFKEAVPGNVFRIVYGREKLAETHRAGALETDDHLAITRLEAAKETRTVSPEETARQDFDEGRDIREVARELGLQESEVEPHTWRAAKIAYDRLFKRLSRRPGGKNILVTAMTPPPTGIGKTTSVVSLLQGFGKLRSLGRTTKKAVAALRQSSAGPNFGKKGPGIGAGMARVIPTDYVSFGFTGDVRAIQDAHNTISSILEYQLFHKEGKNQPANPLRIDKENILWPTLAVDQNHGTLRHIRVGLDFKVRNTPVDVAHDGETVITVASELMAILSVARDLEDLRSRIDDIVVAYDLDGEPVTVKDIGAGGPATFLLQDVMKPNLVQSVEGEPVIVHAAPFANIAPGVSSLMADEVGARLADIRIREAGFDASLGAQKDNAIKSRLSGMHPDLHVIVVTEAGLIYQGDTRSNKEIEDNPLTGEERQAALVRGLPNIKRHVDDHLKRYSVPVLVSINAALDDDQNDSECQEIIIDYCKKQLGVEAVIDEGARRGGEGSLAFAEKANELLETSKSEYTPLYPDMLSIRKQVEALAAMYGADGVKYADGALETLERVEKTIEKLDLGNLQVCMAKTHLSFAHMYGPEWKGAPTGWKLLVEEFKLYAGARIVTVRSGPISLMPAYFQMSSNRFNTVPQYVDFGKPQKVTLEEAAPSPETYLKREKERTPVCSDIGEEARTEIEAVAEKRNARHIVFIRESALSAHLGRAAAINVVHACRDYYAQSGRYTVDIVEDNAAALDLLAAHADWDKTNTIIGAIESDALSAFTGALQAKGMENKARILAMEKVDEKRYVPIKAVFDIMAILVRMDRPLDRTRDNAVIQDLRDLLGKIGVDTIDELVDALTTSEMFDDPLAFARNFILRILPPPVALNMRQLRELYENERAFVQSL